MGGIQRKSSGPKSLRKQDFRCPFLSLVLSNSRPLYRLLPDAPFSPGPSSTTTPSPSPPLSSLSLLPTEGHDRNPPPLTPFTRFANTNRPSTSHRPTSETTAHSTLPRQTLPHTNNSKTENKYRYRYTHGQPGHPHTSIPNECVSGPRDVSRTTDENLGKDLTHSQSRTE